jgi:hypothetical protein
MTDGPSARIEDSREDPGVLEEVVPRWRLGGAVGQGSFCGQPRDEVFRNRWWWRWKSETVQPYGASSYTEQHLNDTARFWAQTGKFILREQPLRANLGQHR